MRAVWAEAESDTRLDLVDPFAPVIVDAPVATRGWPLPDLTAILAIAQLWSEAQQQLDEDEARLRDTYGERWARVPSFHGGLATQAKDILAAGIIPVGGDDADPINVLQQLEPFLKYTTDTAQHLLSQTTLLGECLGSDLLGLSLGDLRRLSRAILRLAAAPPPNPTWCRPAAAHAASIALAALGEDSRDQAWELPAMRAHLGWFADGASPDIDGAKSALAAMQQLHDALGDRANASKLAELAAADAFVSEEVTSVADAIGDAVSAWVGLAKRFNGPDPLAFTGPELSQWAVVTAQSLEVVRVLKETTAPLRSRARNMGELFEDAVARDRVDQLRALLGLEPADAGAEKEQP